MELEADSDQLAAIAADGKPQRRRPVAESSTGPVKISPDGMFRLPSELIQVRPATERVKSVPSASIRIERTPDMNSTRPACRRPSSCQAAAGRADRETRPG